MLMMCVYIIILSHTVIICQEKYASELIEYPYDALWVFNLTMKGTADSGWKKID